MNTAKMLITTLFVAGLISGCASHKTSVYFKPGSANVSNDYKKLLKETAQIAKDKNYRKIKIIGYTDTVGSSHMNEELASKRINAVDKILVKAGINETKVKRAAYGEKWCSWENKKIDNKDDAAMRRVDIKIYK